MATKRKASSRGQNIEELEDETGIDQDASSMPDDDIGTALGELVDGGGGTVRIDKLGPGGVAEYVDDWDAASFTMRELQQQFGGGRFRLSVKDQFKRYRFSKTVNIAAPRVPPVIASEPSAVERLTALVTAQLEQQRKLLEVLAQRLAHPPVAASQPEEVRGQVLQDLRAMREIIGVPATPADNAGATADKLLAAMKLGVELARDSGGGDSDSVIPIVAKVVDTLGEPLAALLSARASSTPTAAPNPIPSIRAPAPAAPAPQNPKEKGMGFAKAISMLVEKAAVNADVTLYADLILDNVPPEILSSMLTGDVVANLSKFDSRVTLHAGWFRELGSVLRDALANDVGDTANPSDDIDTGDDPSGT